MVSFDGGSASKVDDVTALPCRKKRWRICVIIATLRQKQDGGYVLPWQRYDNNKMVAMRYHGNDDSSVTHAGCICAPVNAITTCIYFTHRSDHTKTSVRR